jgi:hypothetical protein
VEQNQLRPGTGNLVQGQSLALARD